MSELNFNGQSKYYSASSNTTQIISTEGHIIIECARQLFPILFLSKQQDKQQEDSKYESNEFDSNGVIFNNLLSHKLEKIVSGGFHFCGITESNQLVTWGINVDLFNENQGMTGQVGHNNDTVIAKPIILHSDIWKNKAVLSVSCGVAHTAFHTDDGVYLFGSNEYAQCSTYNRPNGDDDEKYKPVIAPTLIPYRLFDEQGIMKVVCGAYFTIVLSNSAKIWVWGKNHCGQLATKPTGGNKIIPLPKEITNFIGSLIVDIAAGANHILFLDQSGKIFTCGSNQFGQLGIDTIPASGTHIIQPIPLLENIFWVCIISLLFSLHFPSFPPLLPSPRPSSLFLSFPFLFFPSSTLLSLALSLFPSFPFPCFLSLFCTFTFLSPPFLLALF